MQEAHDRGVVDFGHRRFFGLGKRFVVGELEVEVLVGNIKNRCAGRFRHRSKNDAKFVILDDHRINGQRGLKFDLIQGRLVGRIGYRNGQAITSLGKRDYTVLLHQFAVDGVGLNLLRIVGGKVKQRIAKDFGTQLRDLSRTQLLGRDYLLDKSKIRRLGIAKNALYFDARKMPTLHKRAGDSGKRIRIGNEGSSQGMSDADQGYGLGPGDAAVARTRPREFHCSELLHYITATNGIH